MNEQGLAQFEAMKGFLQFGDTDAANLVSIAPVFDRHGPRITDSFYANLARVPETAAFIEGRVDALKKTHMAWMRGLVGGDYGAAYFESRWRIGMAHVRIGLAAQWVEGVMSHIRTEAIEALSHEIADSADLAAKCRSLTKICDLDLLVINASYAEDRLERLSSFTGMKRALIENIIRIPKKS